MKAVNLITNKEVILMAFLGLDVGMPIAICCTDKGQLIKVPIDKLRMLLEQPVLPMGNKTAPVVEKKPAPATLYKRK
jgi:hypothetical protein